MDIWDSMVAFADFKKYTEKKLDKTGPHVTQNLSEWVKYGFIDEE